MKISQWKNKTLKKNQKNLVDKSLNTEIFV